jgi:large repetitive protein
LSGNTSFTITISPIITPVVDFNYNTPICKNATVNPSPILATGFTTGGVFSSTANLTIDPVTGVINLSSSSVGTYVVTYTLPANPALCQLAGSSTTTITINTIIVPVPTFSYVTPVCKNAGTANIVQGAGFTFGGIFSSTSGLIIDSSTGAINLTTSTAGTYTVNYNIVANATNCFSADSSSSTQIIITPSTNSVTSFSYTSPVCKNGINPSPSLINGFTLGGTFTSTSGLSITASTGVIDLLLSMPGTYTITYTYLNNIVNCITTGSNTATITINPTVNAVTGFSYNSPFCKNDANPSPVFVTGYTTGGTFSSTSGLVFVTGSNGIIDLQASTAGTYVINYAVLANTTTCLLAGNSSTTITINPMVNAVTSFSYTSPVCKDGINPIPNFVAGYTTGGTFSSSPSGLVFVVGSNGVIDLSNSAPGTYTVKYDTPANIATCLLTGFSNATIVINANVNPVNTFSYTSPICKNSPNHSPILPNGFTTGGIFTSTSGLSISPTTGIINPVLSNTGTYIVRYDTSANNSTCLISGSGTATITINPVGTAVTTFSYVSPICKNVGTVSPNTSAVGFTTGGTYSSTTGLILNPATGVVDLTNSTSGTYLITYNVNFNTSTCLAGSSTFSLVITEPTIPTFNPIVTSICKKDLIIPVLQTTSTNGITGTWSPALVSSALVGVVTYTFTPDATFCATKPTVTITTFEPTVTPLFDNVSRSICAGGSIPTLPNTSQNGISGTWSPSIVNATSTGTYTFTSNAGQCAKDLTITITYVPEISSEITSECINANYTLTVNSVGNAFNPNNTYTWIDAAAPSVIIQNGNATSLNVSAYQESTTNAESFPIIYSVQIKTPEGCESTQSFKIDNIYCGIQKGISPNNDNKNDFFDLTNFDVKEFSIFNRYGVKVYVKSGYKNEWVGQTNSGEILPDGTYFYNIEFANNEIKTGWVYINKENK